MKIIEQLNQLEMRGLLNLVGAKPELAYMFRHALVHETAYSSLVREDRKTLHMAVGRAFEALYPEQREEMAAILARHYFKAGELRPALEYFTLAGDVAYRRFAHVEAAMQYSKAIEITKTIRELDKRAERLLHLMIRYGHALELRGDHEQALQVYADLEQYSLELNDPRIELASLVARAKIRSILSSTFEPVEGQALAIRALEIAEKLGDVPAKAKIYWILLLVNFFSHRLAEATRFGELSLELARRHQLREQLAYTLNDLAGFIYLANAKYQAAIKALKEAQAIWRETGNLPMLSDNLTELGYITLLSGDIIKAAEFVDEGYRLDQSIQNAWGLSYSQGVKGFIHFELGEADKAIPLIDASVQLSDKGGFLAGGAIGQSLKSILYTLMGNHKVGLECARDAVERVERLILFWKSEALAAMAFVHLAKDELSEAEAIMQRIDETSQKPSIYFFTSHVALAECEFWLKKQNYERLFHLTNLILQKVEQSDHSIFFPYAHYYQGEAFIQLGMQEQAGETFEIAALLARRASQRHILWKALAAHSKLQLSFGNQVAARERARDAWGVIQYIADHAGSDDLRKSFLGLPAVKEVSGLVL